jgi:hypothetical protein
MRNIIITFFARENVFITTKRFYFTAAASVRGSPRGPAAGEKEEVRYLPAYINPSARHNFHSSEAASQAELSQAKPSLLSSTTNVEQPFAKSTLLHQTLCSD